MGKKGTCEPQNNSRRNAAVRDGNMSPSWRIEPFTRLRENYMIK